MQLREDIEGQSPDDVTETIDRALEEIGEQRDEFVTAAARRVLESCEW